jgi:hypothetical protein
MILYRPRWRLGYPPLPFLVGVLLAAAAPAAESFKKFGPRPIQEVVSADLISGPHYRLTPTVRTFDFLNARDQNGKALVIAPIDYLIWNERAASAVEKVAALLQLKPGENKFELWITGTASPPFKKEAESRGLLVKDRIVTSLPLLD